MPDPDPPATPPTPPADPPASPATPPVPAADDKAKQQREEVKSILAELAASGEIFGGEGGGGQSIDLEAAISQALERRETASKAQAKEQERDKAVADLKDQVSKGLARVRRWFQPASPWGD